MGSWASRIFSSKEENGRDKAASAGAQPTMRKRRESKHTDDDERTSDSATMKKLKSGKSDRSTEPTVTRPKRRKARIAHGRISSISARTASSTTGDASNATIKKDRGATSTTAGGTRTKDVSEKMRMLENVLQTKRSILETQMTLYALYK